MKYRVTVARVCRQTKEIEVEADDPQDARNQAETAARNEDFSGLEKDAEYEIESVKGKGKNADDASTLVKFAEKLGLESEDLDELVHELKGQEAADINNGGLDDQVAFLLQSLGGDADEAREQIERCARSEDE